MDVAIISKLETMVKMFLSFVLRQWLVLLVLLLAILWVLIFSVWADWVAKSPLDEPIALAPKGTIRKTIRIVIPESYQLNLVFDRHGVSFEEMKRLMGAKGYSDSAPSFLGVKVPLRWSLHSIDGVLVVSGEAEDFGSISWSVDEVHREFGHIKINPGDYVFSAEILRDVPEVAHIKTRVSFSLHPKSSSTWQMTLVWWGKIANVIFVWPLILVVGGILIFRFWSDVQCYGSGPSQG